MSENPQPLFQLADQLDEVPPFLRKQPPAVSSLFVVDERVPTISLLAALAQGGFSVVNRKDGTLVITHRPEDWRR